MEGYNAVRRYITIDVPLPDGSSLETINLRCSREQLVAAIGTMYFTDDGSISKFGTGMIEDLPDNMAHYYDSKMDNHVQHCTTIEIPDIARARLLATYTDRVFIKEGHRVVVREVTYPGYRVLQAYIESSSLEDVTVDRLQTIRDALEVIELDASMSAMDIE